MQKLYHNKNKQQGSLYNELYCFIHSTYSKDNLLNLITQIPIIDKDENLNNNRILLKNSLLKIINKIELQNINDCISLYNKIYKKSFINYKKLDKLRKTGFYSKSFIGKIPGIFFKKLKIKKQKDIIAHKIFDLFLQYSTILNIEFNTLSKEYIKNNIKNFSKELSFLIKQPVRLEFLDAGTFGSCYKLTIKNKSFVYKVYYPHKSFDENIMTNMHGICTEPQIGYFCAHSVEKKKFVKFYCGCTATLSNPTCFILTEFIEQNSMKKNASVIKYLDIIAEENNEQNIIDGKIIDFGGIYEKDIRLRNKQLYKFIQNILRCFNYHINIENLFYQLTLDQKGINVLCKLYNDKLYTEACNIINEYIEIPELIKKNIKNPIQTSPFTYLRQFDPQHPICKENIMWFADKMNNIHIINDYTNCENSYLFVSINTKMYRYYYDSNQIITNVVEI